MRSVKPLVVSVALMLGLMASTARAQDEMSWKKDYKTGLQAAKKAGKPLVVHFFTNS